MDAELPLVGLPDNQLYLLGDIGGTNTRLELRDAKNSLFHRRDRLTKDYSSMADALKDFFSDCKIDHKTIFLCVSIAAKVQHNRVVAQSNIPWSMTDGNKLKEEFGSWSLSRAEAVRAAERFRGLCLRGAVSGPKVADLPERRSRHLL
jgi:predicted NBD/HSP70 family sugar kinase